MRSSSLGWLALGPLALVLLTSCAVDEKGTPPPNDVLYYPVFVHAHPAGRYLYINNAVLDRRFNAGTLTVYDTFEHRILERATLDVPLFGGRMALFERDAQDDEKKVYGVMSDRDHPSLTTFEVRAGEGDTAEHLSNVDAYFDFDERPMARDPFDIAIDDQGILVTHLAAGVVSRWKLTSASSGLPALAYNCSLTLPGGAHQVARHPVLGWWYVADRLTSSVWMVSERLKENEAEEGCALQLEGVLSLGGVTSRALAFDESGARIFVVSSSDGSLQAFDTALGADGRPRNSLVGRIALGDIPLNVGLGPCGPPNQEPRSCGRPDSRVTSLLYIPLFGLDEVVVVDPASLDVVARIEVGAGPFDIAFAADALGRMWGYVTHFTESGIGEIDLDPASPNRFTMRASIR